MAQAGVCHVRVGNRQGCPPSVRRPQAAFLDKACGDNEVLREEVESLLQAHDTPDSVPALSGAARGMTEAHQPISERPGVVIGPYKLLQQIGEGGFGVVFMAE
jgi:hypothetical protein